MSSNYDLEELDRKIRALRKVAEEILEAGGEIEAVKRNVIRILASTKMLELNVNDAKEVL
jgi:hypothetical protein